MKPDEIAKLLSDDIYFNNGFIFEDELSDGEQSLLDNKEAKLKDVSPDSKYDEKQLEMGKKVEKEHTNNPALATMIAKHHLDETDPKNSKYYTRLAKLEKEEEKTQEERDSK